MLKPFDTFLVEALDKTYPFIETTDQPGIPKYVFGQYEFDVGSSTIAVRMINGSPYGKKVTKIMIGKKTAKSVSKKLPSIPNIKMFMATVVEIIKFHINLVSHPSGKAKLQGFVFEMSQEDRDKFASALAYIMKTKFKKYRVFEGSTQNVEDPKLAAVYIAPKTRSFEQVFNKVPFVYQGAADNVVSDESEPYSDTTTSSLVASYDDDMDNFGNEPLPELDFEDDPIVQDILSSGSVLKESNTGIYLTGDGNFIAVKDQGDDFEAHYGDNMGWFKLSTVQSMDDLADIVIAGVEPYEMAPATWISHKSEVVFFGIDGENDVINYVDVDGAIKSKPLKTNIDLIISNAAVPQSDKNSIEFKTGVNNNYVIRIDEHGTIEKMLVVDEHMAEIINYTAVAKQITKSIVFIPSEIAYEILIHRADLIKNMTGEYREKLYSDFPEFKVNGETSNNSKTQVSSDHVSWNVSSNSDFTKTRFEDLDLENIEDIIGEFGIGPGAKDKIDIGGGFSVDLKNSVTEIKELFDGLRFMTEGNKRSMRNLIDKYLKERQTMARSVCQSIQMEQDSRGNGLEGDQYTAMREYTGNAYNDINEYLRGKNLSPPEYIKQYVSDLDKAFMDSGMYLPKNFTLYRGESRSDQEIVAIQDGMEVVSKSYSSASMDISTAARFTKISFNTGDILGFTDEKPMIPDDYKRNKLFYSVSNLQNIPVLVTGQKSKFPEEAEVILPRGLKMQIDKMGLINTHERVYTGNFIATGVEGLEGLLESRGFLDFKMFCEEKRKGTIELDPELAAKEMLATTLMVDFVGDEQYDRSDEELDNLYDFYKRMASEG